MRDNARSDAAQILGPMAGAYTGYKLAHQDETKVEASPQEQPPQQPSP